MKKYSKLNALRVFHNSISLFFHSLYFTDLHHLANTETSQISIHIYPYIYIYILQYYIETTARIFINRIRFAICCSGSRFGYAAIDKYLENLSSRIYVYNSQFECFFFFLFEQICPFSMLVLLYFITIYIVIYICVQLLASVLLTVWSVLSIAL